MMKIAIDKCTSVKESHRESKKTIVSEEVAAKVSCARPNDEKQLREYHTAVTTASLSAI